MKTASMIAAGLLIGLGGWIAVAAFDRGALVAEQVTATQAGLVRVIEPRAGQAVATTDPAELLRSGAQPLPATTVGRAVAVPDPCCADPADGVAGTGTRAGSGFRHQWPSVYSRARFEGETLFAAFDDAGNRYRLVIDDAAPVEIDRPGKQVLRFDRLGPGPHGVTIEKISESIDRPGTFAGFYLPVEGAALPPPPPRARAIEFIGDSDMVGYGDMSGTRDCAGAEVFHLTDTQRAYGPAVARRFDADYQVNAHSGIGLIRNYGGVDPGRSMTTLYPRAMFADPTPYDRRDWSPRIVVVALGFNDFATDLAPDERWTDQAALRADFEDQYVRFIENLRALYPDAFVLMAVLSDHDTAYVAAHRATLAKLRAKGTARIDLVTFPPLENTGCHWHPSLRDHAVMAGIVGDFIATRPEIWRAND